MPTDMEFDCVSTTWVASCEGQDPWTMIAQELRQQARERERRELAGYER